MELSKKELRSYVMDNAIWYLKQLMPLTYRTTYEQNGKKIFCGWNMWFGRCFNIERYEIIGEYKE